MILSKPLISVITPVYNCESFVEQSIRSILNQTFTDFELLIVDDCSTDKTLEVVKSISDHRIKVYQFYQNHGCGYGRNHLIKKYSICDFIAIHDGDDISHADRLEKEFDFLVHNTKIFCVGSWAKKIDIEGKEIGIMSYPPAENDKILINLLSHCCPIIDPSTMYRKDIFLKLHGYNIRDEYVKLVPDLDLWCRAAIDGYKFHNIQSELISYRLNPNGVTSQNKTKMIKSHVCILRKYKSDILSVIKSSK